MNALNPMLRIQDQLTDVLEAHLTIDRAARVDRARSLLDLVGIPGDRLRSYPHELSGGMRQRIMIAMALAVEPEIIIMDEPTTALDVVVQQELLGEIAALQQQLGFSVLFITHDLSLLLEIADRLAIMYAGQLMEVASADDLYRQPAHPYTRGLLKSFPPLRGPRRELAGIPGSPPDLLNLPQGCPFHPRCEHSIPSCTEITIALRPLENEADVQHLSACPVIVESLAGLPQTPARPDGTPT
jgi:peptide/nickel transport system ATP-binding protein